jgi:hydroxyacylglutathione hydrolase
MRETGATALVDAPRGRPIRAELGPPGLALTDILITHHHDDHIQAVEAPARGRARDRPRADRHRLPPLD